jgi:hypothetical protein
LLSWEAVMAEPLERTCWRAIQVDHPPEWEVAVASGADDPGRLVFADRCFHRLDICWKTLKYIPNMDLMLSKHRQGDRQDGTTLCDLPTAPAPWKGVVRKTPSGAVVHAGRFFRQERLLVEAALVWPDHRDPRLESRVLESIQAVDADGQERLWQAMGLSVTCPSNFDLHESSLKVGLIQWDFRMKPHKGRRDKPGPQLRIERIALPDYWLKGRSLQDWLAEQVPSSSRQLRQQVVPQGRHTACQVLSTGKAPLAGRLRGYRLLRLDVAWRCPIEERVYHVCLSEPRKDEELAFLEHWEVRCCRAPATAEARRVVV